MSNRERAQQIADEHGNDAYSVALAMLEEQNKIKAEAVREAVALCTLKTLDGGICYSEGLLDCANQMDNKND